MQKPSEFYTFHTMIAGELLTHENNGSKDAVIDLMIRAAEAKEPFFILHHSMDVKTKRPEAFDDVTEDMIRAEMDSYHDFNDLPYFWSDVDPDYYHELKYAEAA